LNVGDLGSAALSQRLHGSGLRIRTGPLVANVRSPLPQVACGLALHYAGHPIEDDDGFADFHVSVDRRRGLRHWVDPRVVFSVDDTQPLLPAPGDQGFALLEWGLNWCIASHCHQYLIVHAAVLERGGKALILPAPLGAGKSTLCAALAFRGGWRLLSDDVALLDPATGCLMPLPRPLCLQDESIDLIRAFAPMAVFGDPVHETAKGRFVHVRPPTDAVVQAQQSAVPAWVVLPHFAAGMGARLEPLSRGRAFMALVDNACNYEVHGRRGFAALADLIDRSGSYRLSYADLGEAIDVLASLAVPTQ
jgi:HprK-related kinase A